jgi:hypothetical protein
MDKLEFLNLNRFIFCKDIEELKKLIDIRYHSNRDSYPFEKKFIESLEPEVENCYYGCSWTYGSCIKQENVWTSQLDKLGGFNKTNNFGRPGAGIEEILRLFVTTTRLFKMKRAIFLLPEIYRYTIPVLYKNEKIQYRNFFINAEPGASNTEAKTIWNSIYSLPEEFFIERARIYIEMMIYISQILNIEIYIGSWGNETRKILSTYSNTKLNINIPDSDRLAEDSKHPGPEAHKIIAKNFFESINS